ncbi:MAG: TIGR00366 family protein [Acidobacteriota bacterium]|nr:TIGR00366 family protein [Acidobacteriota bacterium]
MNRIVKFLVRFFLRWVPDAFVVAALLTMLTFALAIGVAGYSPQATLESWGDSFWNLLEFTNQITLTLLLGYTFANTAPIRRALLRLAGFARTPASAYVLACLITGFCAMFNWGMSLIAGGIMSRAIGESCHKKGIKVHYPLLVASAFSGFVIWHQGLSASIPLALATPGHFLEAEVGIIGISQTAFTPWSIAVVVATMATLPFVMARLRPRGDEPVEEIPQHLMGAPQDDATEIEATTPAEKIERSRVLNLVLVALGLFYIGVHFFGRGDGLNLNILNFSFLIAGILLAGSPVRYIQIMLEGGRVAVPFLLQYPFYAAISGIMADSGLALMVVELFTSISTPATLPFFGFLSGGFLNLFVPSGGGQWAVQGPIMMEAATRVGADLPRVAMSVAFGDQWTNLIQPLSIIPVLSIAGIHLRKIMGYCFVALLWTGVIFSIALLAF